MSRNTCASLSPKEQTDSPSARLAYLDVAKGIAIFLVIFAHINSTYGPKTYIYSFHMPAFFIISGILFAPAKYQNFLAFFKHKLQTLICPYVFFSLLTTLFLLAINCLSNGLSGIEWVTYINHIKSMIISRGSLFMYNSPLWFLTGLFVMQILFYFIAKLYNQKKALAILVCFLCSLLGWVFISGYCGSFFQKLPWSFDPALFSMGFFALGYILSASIKKVCTNLSGQKHGLWICLGIFIVCSAVQIPFAFLNGTISIGSRILNNGFLLYLTGILGTVALLSISIPLSSSKFLAYCGRQSLIIMAIHFLVRDAINIVIGFFRLPTYNEESVISSLLPIILIFLLSLLFSLVYNFTKGRIIRFLHRK